MAIRFCHAFEARSVPRFAAPIKGRSIVAGALTLPCRLTVQTAGQLTIGVRQVDARRTVTHTEDRRDELLALLAGRPHRAGRHDGRRQDHRRPPPCRRLGRHFVDSDEEIEKAAGMTIEDIFATHGEADFRAGEVRVIARLLKDPDMVLGTGGGAFINPETRALVKADAVSVWIKADFELLFARVSRRANRPLLKTANPARDAAAADRGALPDLCRGRRHRGLDATCRRTGGERHHRRAAATSSAHRTTRKEPAHGRLSRPSSTCRWASAPMTS